MRSYTVHCNTISLMLYMRISYVNVVLNPPHCEASGMMESGGSFLHASCGGGFMQPISPLHCDDGIRQELHSCLLWRRIHATDIGLIFIG